MGNEEELLYRATLLKQESEETEKALNFVNEQINELENFKESLKFLEKNKEEEILASLGKGVYVKAKKENERLFVNVGADVIIRKTPQETVIVIEEQIKRFSEAKMQLLIQLQEYASNFREMLKEVENLKKEKAKEK